MIGVVKKEKKKQKPLSHFLSSSTCICIIPFLQYMHISSSEVSENYGHL